MEIKSKYNSPLVLEKIDITEGTFKKKDCSLEDVTLDLKFAHKVRKIEESKYEVTLNVEVSDEDKNIYVYVESRALFRTEQKDMSILEKNTIAIMFPYIRSYITIITTIPGMSPIVLPAMNIVAMLNDKKQG